MSQLTLPQRSLASQDTASLAIVPITGHAEFEGGDTAGVELSDSLSFPETIAERLFEAVRVAVRVEGSGEDTADSLLLPEHWIDPAMVAELVKHARKLYTERVRQESESGGGGGAASGNGAGEARTAAAGAGGEEGGEGKDTASSSSSNSSSSSRAEAGGAPFELAIEGGESDGTAEESQANLSSGTPVGFESTTVPWATAPVIGRLVALRKRPSRVVKLVPVEEDTKGMEKSKNGSIILEEDNTGMERSKNGSIILRDETMVLDRMFACSPCLSKCVYAGFMLTYAVFALSFLVGGFALPFAILKFTNTTDILFGPRVVNASSAAASGVNISNITSDHNEPPWWVDECVCVRVCVCV